MSDDLWIFGYGSLIWRPAFPYVERQPGYIEGYVRRFWQASTDHRGTPEAPGRVVTLHAEPGARCWGMAYRVAAGALGQVLPALDHREQDGYMRLATAVYLGSGGVAASVHQAAAQQAHIDALVYIATHDNPNYLGPASIADIAQVVRSSHGPSGSNIEYVLRLAHALGEIGASDPHVSELARLLED